MKKIILLSAILYTFTANAQYLSLKTLINLQSKNLNDVQEYMASNNWVFSDATEAKEHKMAEVRFAFGKKKIDPQKATSWFHYLYNEKNGVVRIKYQIFNSQHYDDLLNEVKKKDFKLLKTEIKEGKIMLIYYNNDYYLTFSSAKIDDPNSINARYVLLLQSAADFLNSRKK